MWTNIRVNIYLKNKIRIPCHLQENSCPFLFWEGSEIAEHYLTFIVISQLPKNLKIKSIPSAVKSCPAIQYCPGNIKKWSFSSHEEATHEISFSWTKNIGQVVCPHCLWVQILWNLSSLELVPWGSYLMGIMYSFLTLATPIDFLPALILRV